MYGDPNTLISSPVQLGSSLTQYYNDYVSGNQGSDTLGASTVLLRSIVFPVAVLFVVVVIGIIIRVFFASAVIGLAK